MGREGGSKREEEEKRGREGGREGGSKREKEKGEGGRGRGK